MSRAILTTPEQVEALPVLSLVNENIDGYSGFHWWHTATGWQSVGGLRFNPSQMHFPIEVLYAPGDETSRGSEQ